MSLLAYSYYSSDLIETTTTTRTEQKIAYHNDTVLLARGKNFEVASRIIVDMMTRENGALKWAQRHDLIFEIDKTVMLGFTRRKSEGMPTDTTSRKLQCPPILIRGQQIAPQKPTKYLGIIIDDKLRFHEHVAYALENGTKWEIAMRRISKTTKGIPPHLTR